MIGFLIFISFAFHSILQPSDATPISIVQRANGRIYQIHPLKPGDLKIARRDVFAYSPETQEVLGKTTENGFQVTRPARNEKLMAKDEKEILQPASSDSMALGDLLRRSRRAYEDQEYYDRRHDFDDDKDYAGYDRRSSLVGYMDDHDDFPTVVW